MSISADKRSHEPANAALASAANLLWRIRAARRPGVLVRALARVPEVSLEASFASGLLRAALSSAWEAMTGTALPIDFLRCRLERRDDEVIVSAICGVAFADCRVELEEQLTGVLQKLGHVYALERAAASEIPQEFVPSNEAEFPT